MRLRSLTRLLALGLAVATVRRAAMIRRVPADLRVPSTYLPISVVGPRSLARVRRYMAQPAPVADGVEVRVEQVPDGPAVHVYEAAGQGRRARRRGALLWLHGGGYVMGTPANDNARCSELVLGLGVPVVSVDYRLAPEHPAPAGLEDSWTALRWVLDTFDVAPEQVVVAGASAGGGLAAALVQHAHDQGVDVALQLLVYPMLDDRTVRRAAGRRPWLVWTSASNRYAWRSYLGTRPGRPTSTAAGPCAVPARRADLSGLAPAWIGVGDQDQFHDEDVEYAQRLSAAGVPCELHVQPGLFHGADTIFGPRRAATREFTERLLEAGRAALPPQG